MANTPIDHLAEAGKASLDGVQSFIDISLSHLEKLASHNLNSLRDNLLDQVDGARQLLAVKEPQQLQSLQTAHLQPRIEKSIAYFRGIYDISVSAQDAYAKLVEQGHGELNKSISSLLDWYAKSSGSSELAVSAVKSAISAANSAFENANKAARQVADISEASVSAASKATSRAVEAVNPGRRKAA